MKPGPTFRGYYCLVTATFWWLLSSHQNVQAAAPLAPEAVLPASEISSWTVSNDYVCGLYPDGIVVAWSIHEGQVAGQASRPRKPGVKLEGAIALDTEALKLGWFDQARPYAPASLFILKLPTLSVENAYQLPFRVNDQLCTITELDTSRGDVACEGWKGAFAIEFNLKQGRLIWEAKVARGATTRPISPPPSFAMEGGVGYICVNKGEAVARDASGTELWKTGLPRPSDIWNCADRMRESGRLFVIQDRDDEPETVAAFDRSNGKLAWQTSVAASGDILAANDTGDLQVFLKDGKYSLLRLPSKAQAVCELSGDQDVQFSPDGRFLLALPSLQYGSVNPATFTVDRHRGNSTLSIIDTSDGKLVRTIGLLKPK